MMKIRKVIKTGNSLCLTLPKKTIETLDIKEGDIAQYKVSYSKATITYSFSGHPRQLSLNINQS